MAFPTAVNNQITDALAPPGTGAAVSPEIQQQLAAIFQAATTCLVSVMYSQAAAMGAEGVAAQAVEKASMSDAGNLPHTSAPLAAPEAMREAPPDHVTNADAEAWSAGVRHILSALRKEMWDLHELGRAATMEQIKQAALSDMLKQMVDSPEKFEQFEKIVQFIKTI
jgi:hypothetical protein